MILAASEYARSGPAPAHPASPSGNTNDQGTFVLSLGGRTIGTEKFEIRSSRDKIEARAEIQLRVEHEGKTLEFKTSPHLVLNARWEPQTYAWNQRGSQSSRLEIDFHSSPAKIRYRTVTGEEDLRDFDLPKDIVILDDNVLHHFQLVVARYDWARKGTQTLQVFVPQEALPGTLTMELAGTESVSIENRTETLQHFVVTTELAKIDLWVDKQQRLQRVSIPTLQLEAVRQK